MPTIRILPLDTQIETAPGATIMGAARALGYYWPTTCGGEGRCTTCACEIIEGADELAPMGRSERAVLVEERGPSVLAARVRLACQARVPDGAAIVVRKTGVVPPGAGADRPAR
jgi:ferredoxin, 2Fe-2S